MELRYRCRHPHSSTEADVSIRTPISNRFFKISTASLNPENGHMDVFGGALC